MPHINVIAYKKRLTDEFNDLVRQQNATRSARKTVALDQQSVGRLSRMDAMQQQAMAQATQRRRQAEATQIKAALLRIEKDEFGYCANCGTEIDPRRLDVKPTVTTCISCARD